MYKITLTDETETWTLPEAEIPLITDYIDNSTTVETLSNDIYTDKFPIKKYGSAIFSYMSEADYEKLHGFWYRQQEVHFKYPKISIDNTEVLDMTVKIGVSRREIIDHCGTTREVTLNWRESKQNANTE